MGHGIVKKVWRHHTRLARGVRRRCGGCWVAGCLAGLAKSSGSGKAALKVTDGGKRKGCLVGDGLGEGQG